MAKKIAVVVGSLRKGSFTRLMAKTCAEVAPKSLSFTFIDIGKVSLPNQDEDTDAPPASWKERRCSRSRRCLPATIRASM